MKFFSMRVMGEMFLKYTKNIHVINNYIYIDNKLFFPKLTLDTIAQPEHSQCLLVEMGSTISQYF